MFPTWNWSPGGSSRARPPGPASPTPRDVWVPHWGELKRQAPSPGLFLVPNSSATPQPRVKGTPDTLGQGQSDWAKNGSHHSPAGETTYGRQQWLADHVCLHHPSRGIQVASWTLSCHSPWHSVHLQVTSVPSSKISVWICFLLSSLLPSICSGSVSGRGYFRSLHGHRTAGNKPARPSHSQILSHSGGPAPAPSHPLLPLAEAQTCLSAWTSAGVGMKPRCILRILHASLALCTGLRSLLQPALAPLHLLFSVCAGLPFHLGLSWKVTSLEMPPLSRQIACPVSCSWFLGRTARPPPLEAELCRRGGQGSVVPPHPMSDFWRRKEATARDSPTPGASRPCAPWSASSPTAPQPPIHIWKIHPRGCVKLYNISLYEHTTSDLCIQRPTFSGIKNDKWRRLIAT